MKKNKNLFIVFIVLFSVTAVANIARSVAYVVKNISLIVNAPNYKPSDIVRLVLNTLFSKGWGILLFTASLIFFVLAVVFGIKHFRDSEALLNIKTEAKIFSDKVSTTTDNIESAVKRESKFFAEDMKHFFAGVKEKISSSGSINCEHCGAKNNKGVKFCGQCGAPINNQENK